MSTHVYLPGPLTMSVCSDDPVDVMLAACDKEYPTGLDHGWQVADEPFHGGVPNPCACNIDETSLHYLVEC